MSGDRLFGLAIVLVAGGYILSATTIQIPLFPDPMGPRMFPYIIGAGLVICGAVMMLKPDPEAHWPSAGTMGLLVAAAVVMVGYALTLKPLGFLIPTAVTAGILSYMLRPRPLPALLTGVGLSLGLFVLFRYALGLGLQPVPKGWL